MKTMLIALTILLFSASPQCFALRGIVLVSKEKAKEWGLEVRTKANGPQVWVELEFKPKGELKDFSHVELEIREGKKFLLGYAQLREERLSSGNVLVRFLTDRAYLEKIILTVVAGGFEADGYEVQVKDFVEPEKSR